VSNLIPEPMTQDELADVLEDMRSRVEIGDSWEGHIEYLMADPDDTTVPDGTYALVRGTYRIGNRDGGQGGMRMIGTVPLSIVDTPPL